MRAYTEIQGHPRQLRQLLYGLDWGSENDDSVLQLDWESENDDSVLQGDLQTTWARVS